MTSVIEKTSDHSGAPLGFIGLGLMGTPMALNLARSGRRLMVWNRSPGTVAELAAAGAEVAGSAAEVFDRCSIVILMLANAGAIGSVLSEDGAGRRPQLSGRVVVAMGTIAPEDSVVIEHRVRAAGGHYVEAPVSGSRVPAQRGHLVGMLAGEPAVVETVRPLLAPVCRQTVACGPVPDALRMKLAVNHYLVTMVAALAETVHVARRSGLDLSVLSEVLDNGPMASEVSAIKLAKVLADDYSAQAAVADVAYNCELIAAETDRSGIAAPLLQLSRALYAETVAAGDGADDMIAVVRAVAARDPDAGGVDRRSG